MIVVEISALSVPSSNSSSAELAVEGTGAVGRAEIEVEADGALMLLSGDATAAEEGAATLTCSDELLELADTLDSRDERLESENPVS